MQLTGPQIGQFNDVIRNAFDPEDFDLFLSYRLDKRTSDCASSNAKFPVVVNKVLDAAQANAAEIIQWTSTTRPR